ncbi:MAG: guanylate kinase [Bacillota bacterium]|uniref:Guanylate kinase n=2 Tax=Carboxydocella TaxID=178898 RepID=A0A1T4MUX7_9FIRM|nr:MULTISPECIES: guanylate kinase [Carboxydocella]AVX20313.1 guanylate kinase [Carboxydocella thermautotrophica]AVX30737.1 guanylate kinase [Carboxydocella thermautotrophica]SJZ70849.1 guanylate kinase [Carboxydocella sporoproducens DSM 16521]GAW30116.1 guanylate kinase [Carboxydocella sp. ULO1]GAW31142.1 guanylate kinase [Carboxydocella sp. JDF658]
MTGQGLLLVISGPSGAGKGTVCRALMARHPEVAYSVSATTRKPRPGEIDGVHYYFVTRERFEEMIAAGELLEWAMVYESGNYYGTPRQAVLDNLAAGRDVILEIDVQGALQIREKFPEAIFIFILPPSMEELKKRITGRGTESAESISKRLACAATELSYVKKYDYCIVNDLVEKAVEKLEAIIIAEKCRVQRLTLPTGGGES